MPRYAMIFPILIAALLGCGEDSPQHTNLPPLAASNPSPPDSSDNQSTSALLQWSSGSRNGEAIQYDLFFGTGDDPPLFKHALKSTRYQLSGLSRTTTYHWRVVSVNPETGDTPGALWTFQTGAGHAPAAPSNPYPPHATDFAVVSTHVTLQWNGNDLDQDTLTYDVYVGGIDDPPLVAQNIQSSSLTIDLYINSLYYWRVVARDSYGLSTSSRVWWFQTKPTTGHIYNVAGTGTAGFGPLDQSLRATQLYWPMDVGLYTPSSQFYVTDWNNHRVIGTSRSTGGFVLIAGDDGDLGDPCPAPPADCTGIVAAGAKLNHPTDAALDAHGNLVISAWQNSELFLLHLNTGLMDRICGTGLRPCYNGDEQLAVNACVDRPSGVAFDGQGRLCFTDQGNLIVRMIDGSGTIHTIAGTPPTWNGSFYDYHAGFSGDEGPATSATLNFDRSPLADPSGKICFNPSGNLYIADTKNHAVRVVDSAGIIHRFAGVYPASPGFDGDGGPATSAHLFEPRDVASDSNGNIYIADTGNHVVRVVTLNGMISTVAGVPMMSGDGESAGVATATLLSSPSGIAIAYSGNLWIADTRNNRIRVVYR